VLVRQSNHVTLRGDYLPFRPDPLLDRLEPLRQGRAKPWIGYGAALVGCALAVAARKLTGDLLADVPFITFYPAIALAALLGGWRAGGLAMALSAALANVFFLQPTGVFELTLARASVTILFLFVASLIVGPITLLNEVADRSWRQAENTRFILEAEPAGVIAVDDEGTINLVNAAVEKQLGYPRAELLGQPVEVLVPITLRAGHETLRGHFMGHPEPRSMGAGRDLNAVRKDGSLVPVEVGLNPYQVEGRGGALATIIDISERKRLESRSQVLAHEVSHRANNLLMVVQVLAKRLLTGSQRNRFLGVIEALARTHGIFAEGASATLHGIIEAEFAGFAGQVELAGCNVRLKRDVAQDLTLIVHELTTNALKYGALSTSDGRVSVFGELVDSGLFRFVWSERGGPAVSEPSRRGFGSSILGKVARGFAMEVSAEYRCSGFRYELICSLERIGTRLESEAVRAGLTVEEASR
jgi:PAS domain S-box-containing protein